MYVDEQKNIEPNAPSKDRKTQRKTFNQTVNQKSLVKELKKNETKECISTNVRINVVQNKQDLRYTGSEWFLFKLFPYDKQREIMVKF